MPMPGAPPGPGGAVLPFPHPAPNPAMAAAPAQVGPGVMPQGNAGNAVKAMSDVRNAVKMLETALPNVPMGTPLHTEILNTTKALLKHLQPGDASPGLDLMSLLQMARNNSQAQPMQTLARAFPNAQNAPPAVLPGAAPQPQAA